MWALPDELQVLGMVHLDTPVSQAVSLEKLPHWLSFKTDLPGLPQKTGVFVCFYGGLAHY